MKIKRFKLITVLMWFVLGSSCLTSSGVNNQSDESSLFLWEVTSGESTVYLAGSVHMAPEGIYPLDERYYKALNSSENFVMEADIKNLDQAEAQRVTLEHGIFMGNENLETLLPGEYQEKLNNKILPLYGMSFSQVKMFKPWLLTITLTTLNMQSASLGTDSGVDLHFLDKADELGLNKIYLESVSDQIEFLSGSPMSAQTAGLVDLIDSWDSIQAETKRIIDSWVNNDVSTFTDLFLADFNDPELKPTYDILLKERNYNWADQIETFFNTGEDYFIVVGSGHLVGNDSVQKILEDRGYRVKGY